MRATTRLAKTNHDLNDVAAGDGYLFVRQAIGIAGRGIAARVPADEAADFLATIEHIDETGLSLPGPIACGLVPFLPNSESSLIVPQVVVAKNSAGLCWITTIDDATLEIPPPTKVTSQSATFTVRPLTPIATYLQAVTQAREAVRAGQITKAVIAREIIVTSSLPIDLHAVLLRLRASFSSSYRYSIDGFIGASPELLISIDGPTVRSHPLAGTVARTGNPILDEELARGLLLSMKDQIEHRIVIDVIHDMLLPWCSYLDWEPEPTVLQVANVQHLATLIEGHLSDPRPPIISLVRQLSPTPALGGHPRDAALSLIAEFEGFQRGHYGGAVGWLDGHGNGTWAVAIRCAELSADRCSARLIAGGGIVAQSDPLGELDETHVKFRAMLSALIGS